MKTLALLAGLLCVGFEAAAATFTVTTTNHTGSGSLRQAILDANAAPGADVIAFNITTGVSIIPTNALPFITDPLTIDGTTQPGFLNAPIIELSGQSAGSGSDGLRIITSNCVIRGLTIIRFLGDGIEIATNGNNIVEGCVIGLDATGTDRGNSMNGIFINRSANNRIGETNATARNVISGNSDQGILIAELASFGNVIQGNFIGTDSTGTLDRGNSGDGVQIDDAPNNVIGGATTGARNVISGNTGEGVEIFTAGATNNSVLGNFIGTDVTGTLPLLNSSHGVWITTSARWNVIGGTNNGAGNLIAFNDGDGIYVQTGTNNAARANRMHSNVGLGIDIGANGVTANDATDSDAGANQLQNFPGLTNASGTVSGVMIQGSLTSRASTTYQIDFFANQLCDPSGNGEGQFWLGSTNVTTDGSGNAGLNITFPVALPGRFITATSTDPLGNTSEFSPCVRASSTIAPATFTVINTNNSGVGSLRQAILDSNARVSSGTNRIQFNIPGAGVQTVAPSTPLPAISEAVVIDGYSQPGATTNTLADGFNANLLVRLDGVDAGTGVNGLALSAGNSTVRGLIIMRFNASGIHATAGSNMISGNVIGLDADGTDRGNGDHGVFIESSAGNVIGGTTPASRNVISGNGLQGVLIANTAATGNIVQGNLIGTDLSGTLDRGNSGDGVQIDDAPNNVIGGTIAAARNVISGNSGDGIQIFTVGATNNLVIGNFIGADVAGTQPLPNAAHGVTFSASARWNSIGRTNSGADNLIAFNGGDGVFVSAGTNNAMRANRIHSNDDLGLDIGANNVTTNDVGDADSGANQLQNFPLLINVAANSGNTVIQGTLNSRATTAYALDFFSSGVCDASGNGEGQFYLGSTNVTTDGSGNANFSVTLPVTISGRYITATATDPFGNTSEFSPCVGASSTIPPATFTVINTNNAGAGSLRQAILDSNARVSASNNVIVFNIAGAVVQTIAPVTELPAIVEPVTVDGFTQPGASVNTLSNGNNAMPRIRLNGTNAGAASSGVVIVGSNSVVRGLIIVRFGDYGIELSGARRTRLEGNFIGVDADSSDAGNTSHGVYVNNSAENVIGGLSPAARNVISGNNGQGILIANPPASNNIVLGNFIGTDPTGTLDRGNTGDGVQIDDAPGNLVGGTVAGARNLISGNNGQGVEIFTAGATNNTVQGNFIGTDISGVLPLANSSYGVWITTSARGNLIGGTNAAAGNVLAFNGADGVFVQTGTNNTVRANAIGNNTGLGIDLGGGGVTANDAGDGDGGANLLQNFPVLTSAVLNVTSTAVQGTFNSGASATFQLDFYSSLACDASGNGEGEKWLGSGAVTTDGSGNVTFNFTLAGVASGRFITATATDARGNSSEFSPCVRATSTRPPQTFTVVNTSDSGAGSLRQALLDNNRSFNGSPNTVRFDVPGSGVRTIGLLSALPEITESVSIDGYTQPGSSANSSAGADNAVRLVRLDGDNMPFPYWGVALRTDNSAVRGLVLVNFPGEAVVINGNSNVIAGNALGLDTDNTTGFNDTGVRVGGGSANRIGGTAPADRNLISGNSYGVVLASSTNCVQGNFIGADATGAVGRGNSLAGIQILGAPSPVGNVIGGTASGARNLISGNYEGIQLIQVAGTAIEGNFIGTDITGTAALNNYRGIRLVESHHNVIGGVAPGAGNVISGNGNEAIVMETEASNGNVIQGNRIGTDVSGTLPLGNYYGVDMVLGSSNVVGGAVAGAENIIAFNRFEAVRVGTGTNNSVLGNSISDNDGLGIRLGLVVGVTANDPGDGDAGANQLQNYPDLSYAIVSGGQTTVRGRLNSWPGRTYRVEFFHNSACDGRGFGEGKNFLGATNVMTDAGGNVVWNITFAGALPLGEVVTATATDSEGNTSEFSACASVVPTGSVNLRLVGNDAPDPVRLGEIVTYTFGVTNVGPAMATGVMLTNLLPAGATYVSATPSQGSCGQAAGVVNCGLGSLALDAGASITVMARLNTPGRNTNSTSVTASQPENVPGDNSATLITVAGISDLATAMTASPDPITAGQPLTLNVAVTNLGPDTASGVVIHVVPGRTGGFSYRGLSGSTASGSISNLLNFFPSRVDWRPAALAPGAFATAQVILYPIRPGPHTNDVRLLTLSGVDTNASNNVAFAGGAVIAGPGILDLDEFYAVREDAGSAVITVRRIGGANGTVTANYSTAPVTATAGSDYTATSGTVTFTNGQLTATFTVPVINDGAPECNETVQLRLTNPTGGAALIERTNALLHIFDNDYPAPPLPELVSAPQMPGRISPDDELATFFFSGGDLPAMTPDGRYVVFSTDVPLITPDDNEGYDVFVYDRVTRTTSLASVNKTGAATGNDESDFPSISDNGRFVAFESDADDLVSLTDTNGYLDVFVRDLVTGTTTLVSVNASGTSTGEDASDFAKINATGHLVVFESDATNLVNVPFVGTPGLTGNVFVRNLTNNTTALVSINQFGTATGNGDSGGTHISSNGVFVLFASDANDLVPGDTNGFQDVFVRNLTNGTTALVSVNRFGTGSGNGRSYVNAISHDGRYIAFSSEASNLVTNDNNSLYDVFVRDMVMGVTTLVSVNRFGTGSGTDLSYFNSMTRNGRYIGFDSRSSNLTTNDLNGAFDAFVRDIIAGTTTLVSVRRDGGGTGSDDSEFPYVSEDGRYVAFESYATNLVAETVEELTLGIYLRDLLTGTTSVLTTNGSTGEVLDGTFTLWGMSGNGHVVVFEGSSSDLIPGDGNDADDIYIRDWTAPKPDLASSVFSATPSRGAFEDPLPLLSADGRTVVFVADSDDLVSGDLNEQSDDVFARDLVLDMTAAISRNAAGTGTGNDYSSLPSMTPDGRFVAFESCAVDLLPVLTDGACAVFLRDRVLGATAPVSVNTNGVVVDADETRISANGRFVAFQSGEAGLAPGDGNGRFDVFVRDMLLGKTVLASASSSGASANNQSFIEALSPNGRYVTFESGATNLVAGDTNNSLDTFIRDMVNGTTDTLSGGPPSGFRNFGSFSSDGRFCVFPSSNPALAPNDSNARTDVFIRDLVTGALRLISRNAAGTGSANGGSTAPAISANGRYVVFESDASDLVMNDTNALRDVFRHDLWTGTTELVSVNCEGTASGNGYSETAVNGALDAVVISADGRFVAFDSEATDLAPGDYMPSFYNVFVRDMLLGQTRLVSVNNTGTAAAGFLEDNYGSYYAQLSADGGTVVFVGDAFDLIDDDRNLNIDVFAVRLPTASPSAELSLTMTGTPNPVGVGSNLTYTLIVTNHGPAVATNIVLVHSLPGNAAFVSANVTQGSFGRTNNTLVVNIGTLAVGARATLTVTVNAGLSGTLLSVASVTGYQPDLNPANNYGAVTTDVGSGGGGPQPTIALNLSGNQLELSWPSPSTGYSVQQTATLSPPVNWLPATNAVMESGGRFRVTVDVTAATRFFRLAR